MSAQRAWSLDQLSSASFYDDIETAYTTRRDQLNALTDPIAKNAGLARLKRGVAVWGHLEYTARERAWAELEGSPGGRFGSFQAAQRTTNADFLDDSISIETWLTNTKTNAVNARITSIDRDTVQILQRSRVFPAL